MSLAVMTRTGGTSTFLKLKAANQPDEHVINKA
jgi:hypothetical protein